MAINFPNSPATNDTFVSPTGIEYIYDGVKWRSFKPTEPVIGTFNANSAISLTAGGTNQNITLTPSGTGIVTVPSYVGIGTTTPNYNLHINSTFGSSQIQFTYSTSGTTASDGFIVGSGTAGGFIRQAEALPIIFSTNNTQRFSFNASGAIGLGSALNYGTSGQTIICAGSGAVPNWGTLPVAGGGTGVTSSTGTGSVVLSAAPTFTGNTVFDTSTLVIDSTNSRVGIGTTTPAVKLQVAGAVRLGNLFGLSWGDGTAYISGDTTASTLSFAVGGAGAVSIVSGNVGIGTSPAAKLDVLGTTRIQAASGGGILNILPDAATFTSEVRLHTNSGGSTYQILKNSSGTMTIGTIDANPMTFLTNNVERVRVNSAANSISIGTATTNAWNVTSGAIDLGAVGGVYGDAGGGILATNAYYNGTNWIYKTTAAVGIYHQTTIGNHIWYSAPSGTAAANVTSTEYKRLDLTGNMYLTSGNFWQYTPAPTALAAGANAIAAAALRGQIFTVASAVTTAVTFTLPLATALDTLFAQVPATNIGFDFYIINAGVTSAAVTVAVNTGITLGAGSLTVAIGTSAQFRLRRTAANTYLLYRMG